mmetsp:Transcript_32675/g.90111  ORF Transcript_32675/g.90111 Transcript_32675/m.90111 type:complete len:312 (-) Transcript_32675:2056-2991(-)
MGGIFHLVPDVRARSPKVWDQHLVRLHACDDGARRLKPLLPVDHLPAPVSTPVHVVGHHPLVRALTAHDRDAGVEALVPLERVSEVPVPARPAKDVVHSGLLLPARHAVVALELAGIILEVLELQRVHARNGLLVVVVARRNLDPEHPGNVEEPPPRVPLTSGESPPHVGLFLAGRHGFDFHLQERLRLPWLKRVDHRKLELADERPFVDHVGRQRGRPHALVGIGASLRSSAQVCVVHLELKPVAAHRGYPAALAPFQVDLARSGPGLEELLGNVLRIVRQDGANAVGVRRFRVFPRVAHRQIGGAQHHD